MTLFSKRKNIHSSSRLFNERTFINVVFNEHSCIKLVFENFTKDIK